MFLLVGGATMEDVGVVVVALFARVPWLFARSPLDAAATKGKTEAM